MQEKILELLKGDNPSLSIYELNDLLGLKTADDMKSLVEVLNDMEKKLLIYRSNKNKYLLMSNSHLKSGRLSVNKKGFGFVLMDNGPDIRIDASNMNGAIHNDLVLVEMINRNDGRIIRVVNRELGQLVGEYYLKNNIGHVKLDDPKYKIDIIIDPKDSKGSMEGHKVLVKTTEELGKGQYQGEVLKILGHKEDPGVDILSIVYEHGINDVFSDAVMEEVENVPSEVDSSKIGNRRDLRNITTFTIDGDDAKDFDDAVSIKKLDNGNYLLGVHIADVSYYVKEDSELDKEAYDRGTSVYLVDRVIPMLPHKLSNGICSLNEKVDRLTVTCEMEIDDTGNIVKHDIYESIINSKKRMTYKNVNRVIEKKEKVEGYEDFVDELELMAELAHILRTNKENRGYIDFDTEELKIVVDETGKPIDVKIRERGAGEKLIEDFMIAANETVATHIFHMDLPFVYRIHETPKEQKMTSFLEFVSLLGYKVKGKRNDFSPKAVQGMLATLRDKKEFPILSSLLLRCMQKAIYLPENLGHYGLASQCYTHFTSPIRRYPDTTVHRLLRTYLFEHQIDNNTVDYWHKKLVPLCEHSSIKEQDAAECERDVDDLKAAEYMEQHVGEQFEGMISNVIGFGMFVELDNGIEGLIHINDLKDDYYDFNEIALSLIGQKNKKVYRIGDRLKIKVKAASKQERTIDFEIVEKINVE